MISWILVTMLCSCEASGQVANNNINARTKLHVDESPTPSYTGGATVEWNCINKALTNKCLSYHNDQWFTFSVEDGRHLFFECIDASLPGGQWDPGYRDRRRSMFDKHL